MLALLGILGTVLAGAMFIGPLTADGQETDETAQEDVHDDALGDDSESDLLDFSLTDTDEDEFPLLGETPEEASGAPDGEIDGGVEPPDYWSNTPSDQIYGQNIGDNFGASMFHDIHFQTDAVTGSEGDDALTGGDALDFIFGNGGDDTISGGDGSDHLQGDMGDDAIFGGPESDLLFGGEGDDAVDGGTGSDFLSGGGGDDTLLGGKGDDVLFGGFGADLLDGGDGNDVLDGTQATVSAPSGTDSDTGDTLLGGAGDDTLIVGAGDTAEGGDGADQFISGAHVASGAVPVISDFEVGVDRLEVLVDPSLIESSEVTTETTPDGLRVMVNGTPVADLRDIPAFDPADIQLIPQTAA